MVILLLISIAVSYYLAKVGHFQHNRTDSPQLPRRCFRNYLHKMWIIHDHLL